MRSAMRLAPPALSAAALLPLALLSLGLLGTGCVSASVHEQLQKDHEALRQQHTALGEDNEAVKKALAEEQATRAEEKQRLNGLLAATGERVGELELKAAGLDSELTSLQAEKAELVKGKSRLKASVADMKVALSDAQKRKAQAEKRARAYEDLLLRFKPLIDAGKLQVKITDGRMIVQLATDVLFASGSAALSEEGEAAVSEVSKVLFGIPSRRYEIAGHTDNVPMRNSSNWDLAFDRARSVLDTMVLAGMPTGRVHASSYGEFRPVASNDTPEDRARNRRIEIVIVPDLSMLPGAGDLEKLDAEG